MKELNKLQKMEKKWKVVTNKKNIFITPNIIIAGGVGSFEPRKFPLEEAEKFEEKGVFYSVKNKNYFTKKKKFVFLEVETLH